jgi:hypothetical protein
MMNDEEKTGSAEAKKSGKSRREEKTRFSQLRRFLTSSLPAFSWAVL